MNPRKSAPDPVLGFHADAVAAQRSQRLIPFARAGMNFCVASAAAFAAAAIIAVMGIWHGVELPRNSSDKELVLLTTLFWIMLSTWFVCQLIGISLCIYAWKSRVVKAALVTALVLVPYMVVALVEINNIMIEQANHLN